MASCLALRLLEDVRALLIDLDGVPYVEQEPTAGAAKAVRRLRPRGRPLRFCNAISSAPS